MQPFGGSGIEQIILCIFIIVPKCSIDWNNPQSHTTKRAVHTNLATLTDSVRELASQWSVIGWVERWRREERKDKAGCEGFGKRRGNPADEWASGRRQRGGERRGEDRPSRGLMEHGSGFRILPLQWVPLFCFPLAAWEHHPLPAHIVVRSKHAH